MKKKSSLRLSQCMIVKNEENNIRQALDWGKGIVWEKIVVDTGSTDRTVEIAESMGATVYSFEWINDFSAAKNYAISKASGDWIAFLDADEYLTDEWAQKLLLLLEKADNASCYAVRTPLLNLDDDGKVKSSVRHVRFFRREKGLAYQNPIHEVLKKDGNALSFDRVLDTGDKFPIFHTGYTKEASKRKNIKKRNMDILEAELKKNPDNYDLLGYLGDCYRMESETVEMAADCYRKAVSLFPQKFSVGDERSACTFIYLMVILYNAGDEQELLEIYDRVIRQMPWVYDADYLMGCYYLTRKDYQKVIFHFERTLQITEQYGRIAYGVYLYSNLEVFWERLILSYYEIGNLSVSVQYSVSFLKQNHRNITVLILLLLSLKEENPEAVVRFLGNIYQLDQPSDRIFLIRAAVQAGAEPMLDALKSVCTPEEMQYIEQAKKTVGVKDE